MAMLVGLMPISGGVDWQITRADNPGVLHAGTPRAGCHRRSRPRCLAPEVGQEAWTLDFDAVRNHLHPETSSHFPAWARGQLSATPSEVGP